MVDAAGIPRLQAGEDVNIGYRYWHMQRHRFGWRQVGSEMLCVMDDYGFLVPAEGARC